MHAITHPFFLFYLEKVKNFPEKGKWCTFFSSDSSWHWHDRRNPYL